MRCVAVHVGKGAGVPIKPLRRPPFRAPTKLPPILFRWWAWWGLGLEKCSPSIAVRRGAPWYLQGLCTGGGGGLWIHTADSGVPNAGYPLACRMCPRPNLAWDGQNKRHNPLLSHFTQLGDQIGITLYTSSLTGHSQYGHCHGMLLVDATRLAPILSWKTRWVCTRMCQHTLT